MPFFMFGCLFITQMTLRICKNFLSSLCDFGFIGEAFLHFNRCEFICVITIFCRYVLSNGIKLCENKQYQQNFC